MLKFNTLLNEAGFNPGKVFLLRHEDKRVPSGPYLAWKSAPKDFEAYQKSQKWKNRFPEGSNLAAFVVGPERETLFAHRIFGHDNPSFAGYSQAGVTTFIRY
jgi:hypothetical protein